MKNKIGIAIKISFAVFAVCMAAAAVFFNIGYIKGICIAAAAMPVTAVILVILHRRI